MNNRRIADKDKFMRRLAYSYFTVKRKIIKLGFAGEIDWQEEVHISRVNESQFLREAAWVILCGGMRESVIRKIFASITEAFEGWTSTRLIVVQRDKCRRNALKIFNHPKKIDAILDIAKYIDSHGIENMLTCIEDEGISYLTRFPFIGPVTSFHLAKNVGLPVSKSDRHLKRIAEAVGFDNPDVLCRTLSEFTGDKISVIDLVLWRYATLSRNYVEYFKKIRRNPHSTFHQQSAFYRPSESQASHPPV